jgi:4-aminobutyrate aminotransferase-like enzyme/Ser/Thr protein kinase RdoA (MazF antagonist)
MLNERHGDECPAAGNPAGLGMLVGREIISGMSLLQQAPRFDTDHAAELARQHFGIDASATRLPSERDQNFLLHTGTSQHFVLKIANGSEAESFLDAQNKVLEHLASRVDFCPRVIKATSGEATVAVGGHLARLVTWLPGRTLGEARWHSAALLENLGVRLGQLRGALEDFDHPATHRDFYWDPARATQTIGERISLVVNPAMRRTVEQILERLERDSRPRLERLPRSVVHNDANDYNVLVSGDRVTGLIDFGDMVHTYSLADPAVAMAYASLDKPDPLAALAAIARGYHSVRPFSDDELAVLFELVCVRLCVSVAVAADQQRQRPGDEYLAISQEPIERTLPRLVGLPPSFVEAYLRTACTQPWVSASSDPNRVLYKADDRALVQSPCTTLVRRQRVIGRNLSVAYDSPLKIVRGWMQYLFDEDGRRYIDAYNNVPHVGHAHPRVADAVDRQTRALNTNTRYLHDNLVEFAEQLISTMPDPLRVCYFVNSGSEANELALRLARTCTRQRDVIVLDAAYHGHTNTLIDISPYKFNGPGGGGKPEWVHVAPVPDVYRGPFKSDDPDAGRKYASAVGEIVERLAARGAAPAAFLAETCPSVGGQIVPPPGYLAAVYACIHGAGGVCIADEVQTAYGRMGATFYAFQDQGVVPDIVVLGKPIGNGYPLGAVVTTEDVARAFDNGMEFFSTFGGSTVSCAAGRAVLDVVLQEELQMHASRVGDWLRTRLAQLGASHQLVGDVRGSGLFLGVELVRDRATQVPATAEATRVVNRMREEGILLGTDGPFHNVLKIRPPMPFTLEDASVVASVLDRVLSEVNLDRS